MSRPAHHGLLFLCAFLAAAASCHASIGLVVGEPFGSFGTMLPGGHAGVYLDHLCAETPTHLRLCHTGESGVVVSRYHDLQDSGTDWLAVPALTFFYGVDSPAKVPAFITPTLRDTFREQYRETHFASLAPLRRDRHGRLHAPLNGDWAEAVGAAFDRRLFLYTLATSAEQDAALLDWLNTSPNQRHYSITRSNCADFASDLLSVVLPGTLHRAVFSDLDIAAPKTLARQMEAYGQTHPELAPRLYVIPQVAGTLRRSRPTRGGAEMFLTTKRYLFTLIVIQPEFVLADTAVYLSVGRWKVGRGAVPLTPADWTQGPPGTTSYSLSSTASSTASDAIGFAAK